MLSQCNCLRFDKGGSFNKKRMCFLLLSISLSASCKNKWLSNFKGSIMNKRHYYLASCLALLFSTASYAEVDCELQPAIEANLSLNQNQLASNGGYISSQLGIRNESCETVKFKYWLSIKDRKASTSLLKR